MAPRGQRGRPRSRRRPGSFARDEEGNFVGHGHRSGHSLKPREERAYQEFHPDLDVTKRLLVITTTDTEPIPRTPVPSIVPLKRKAERPLTPVRSSSRHSLGKNGTATPVLNGQLTPKTNGVNGTHTSEGEGTGETSMPTPETPRQDGGERGERVPFLDDRSPLAILRQNLAAALPMSRSGTNISLPQEPEFEVIAPFKDTPYIGRSMVDVGYQESEYWSRPQESYIRFYGIRYEYQR